MSAHQLGQVLTRPATLVDSAIASSVGLVGYLQSASLGPVASAALGRPAAVLAASAARSYRLIFGQGWMAGASVRPSPWPSNRPRGGQDDRPRSWPMSSFASWATSRGPGAPGPGSRPMTPEEVRRARKRLMSHNWHWPSEAKAAAQGARGRRGPQAQPSTPPR